MMMSTLRMQFFSIIGQGVPALHVVTHRLRMRIYYIDFTNLSDSSWMNMERIAFRSQGWPTNIRSRSGDQFVGYSFIVLLLQYLQRKVGNRLDKFKVMVSLLSELLSCYVRYLKSAYMQ